MRSFDLGSATINNKQLRRIGKPLWFRFFRLHRLFCCSFIRKYGLIKFCGIWDYVSAFSNCGKTTPCYFRNAGHIVRMAVTSSFTNFKTTIVGFLWYAVFKDH